MLQLSVSDYRPPERVVVPELVAVVPVVLPDVPAPIPCVPLPAVIEASRVEVVVVLVSVEPQEVKANARAATAGMIRISFFMCGVVDGFNSQSRRLRSLAVSRLVFVR